jgi:peptidyl-prolyl cis-trans isomerase C
MGLTVSIPLFTTASEPQKEAGKVAVVNGSVITQQDFDVALNAYLQEVSMRMGREVNENEMAQIKSDLLEQLIDQRLLVQESKKKDIKIDEKKYQDQIDRLQKELDTDPNFKALIEQTKYSIAEIKGQIRDHLMISAFVEQTFFDPATVSDEETKAYYDKNKEQFVQPEQVRAQHILIKPDPPESDAGKAEALKKIKGVQDKLKAGQDFAALATEYSQCPSSSRGGDLNFFGRGQMTPPFEAAAFALKVNEVSDIVETDFGYHLIKLTGRTAKTVLNFEEVKDSIASALKKETALRNLEAFLDASKKSGTISLF